MPGWATTEVREGFQRRNVYLWLGGDYHRSHAGEQYDNEPGPADRALARLPWKAVYSDSPSHVLEDCLCLLEKSLAEEARREFRRPIPVSRPRGDSGLVLGRMLPIYYLRGRYDAPNREERFDALPPQVRDAYRGSLVVGLSSIRQENGVLVITGHTSRQSLLEALAEARAFIGDAPPILVLDAPEGLPPDASQANTHLLPFGPMQFADQLERIGLLVEPGRMPEASVWIGTGKVRIDDLLAGPLGRLDRSYRIPTVEAISRPENRDRDLFDSLMLPNEGRDAVDVFTDSKEWRGIAAGFCVPRRGFLAQGNTPLVDLVLQQLKDLAAFRADEPATKTLELPVEPGAGTTTMLHWLSYECARQGYPCFILKQDETDGSIGELTNVLTGIYHRYRDMAGAKESQEVPALVVYDTQHADLDDVVEAAQRIGQAGRRCVVLRPFISRESVDVDDGDEDIGADARNVRGTSIMLNRLSADASGELVRTVREHFARLRDDMPELGLLERSQEDWQRYQETNSFRVLSRGQEEAAESLFWVALHYFLTSGQYDPQAAAPVPKCLGERLSTLAHDDPSCAKTLLDISRFSLNGLYVNTQFLGRLEGDTFSRAIIDRTRRLEHEQLVRYRWEEETGENLYRLRHRLYAQLLLQEAVERRSALVAAGLPPDSIPAEADLSKPIWMLVSFLERIDGSVPGDIHLAEEIADGALRIPSRRALVWRHRTEIVRALAAISEVIRNSSRVVNHIYAMALWRTAAYDAQLSDEEREERFRTAVGMLDHALLIPSRQRQRDEHPGHILTSKGYAQLWWSRRSPAERSFQLEEDAANTFRDALRWIPSNTYSMYGLASILIERAERARDRELPRNVALMVAEALNLLQALPEQQDFRSSWFRMQERAVSLVDSRAPAKFRENLREANEEAGFLLEAWAVLGRGRIDDLADDTAKMHAYQWVVQALKHDDVKATWRARYLAYRLIRATKGLRGDLQTQYELLRLLRNDEEFSLRPTDQFELGVLCYQLDRLREGVRVFKDLRATGGYREIESAASRFWLEATHPFKPRRATLTVKRCETPFKGWGNVPELSEDVPFTPVHFDPDHMMSAGTSVPCYVRFSGSGPKAVPERFYRQGASEP